MTTIDILKWEGSELLQDYADYILAGTAEAKAIASQDSGAMVRSVTIRRSGNGFIVDVPASELLKNRKDGGRDYYPHVYVNVGYPRWAKFDFITAGFKHIGNRTFKVSGSWSALRPSGRRGSGSADIGEKNLQTMESFVNRYKSRGRVGRIPARLRKE